MPHATGILVVISHESSGTALYGLIVIVSTVATGFLCVKAIDKPNIDQKELQYLQRALFRRCSSFVFSY